MSLLLDALNRASKDKAEAGAATKAATGGEKATPPVLTTGTTTSAAVKPTPATVPPGTDWPTIGLELTPTNHAPTAKSEPVLATTFEKPTPNDDGLKLVAEPEKTPASPPVETIAAAAMVMHSGAPIAQESPNVQPLQTPTPKPAPKTVPTFVEPKRSPPPPDSPRVAQSILRAKAPVPGNGKSTRLIFLSATAALLAAGLGSVMFGLWGDPMDWLQTSTIQASSISPPVSPTETVTEPPMPDPIAAVAAAADIAPAPVPREPVQIAPVVAKSSPIPSRIKAPPSSTEVASRAQEIRTECGAGLWGPGCTEPRSKPAAAPSPKTAPTLLKTSSAGPSALETGYAALIKGRLQEASQAYNQALSGNPEERDALLGLAYIAHQQGHEDDARAYYKRVLRQDPGNPIARSGLLTLSPSADANELGSRAGEVAEQNPDSAAAQSALGHGLVRQGRLADAQLAFQRAQSLEPTVALHAFNLAVALDRLRNYDPALNYYMHAVALSTQSGGERTSGVPHAVVQSRIDQLRSAMGPKQ